LEHHAGGDIHDRGVDGSSFRWGGVLTFDPPQGIGKARRSWPKIVVRLAQP
jgi:hypothetical protein